MKISQPVPELPVPDVVEAQRHYRDQFGFRIDWYNEEGRIGAVSCGDCAIFFRAPSKPLHPSVFWVFTEELDQTFAEVSKLGAGIVDPPSDKPWGLRQFTLRDRYGNIFHFHHDI